MKAIIVSKKDTAGMNIKECLENYDLEKYDTKLFMVEKESVFNENIDEEIDADFFIFATKHKSESKINSLSVHTAGNWTKAANEHGGQDRKLCIAPAAYLKMALLKLMELAKDIDFEVVQECSHHGPFLESKPSMFIEIGSSEEQWKNKQAGEIIAKTIIYLLENKPPSCRAAFGIGGLHHTPILTKTMLKTDIAFGHVCPKYMLEFLDKEMILQAIEKTEPKAELGVLDWKGLGKEKTRIKGLLEESPTIIIVINQYYHN